MAWKGFVSAVGQLTIALFMANMISFVVLNLLVGCESWENSACITPTEFFSMFAGGELH